VDLGVGLAAMAGARLNAAGGGTAERPTNGLPAHFWLHVARHRPISGKRTGVPFSTGEKLAVNRAPERLTFGPCPTARLCLRQRRPIALARVDLGVGLAAMAGARLNAAGGGTAERPTYGLPAPVALSATVAALSATVAWLIAPPKHRSVERVVQGEFPGEFWVPDIFRGIGVFQTNVVGAASIFVHVATFLVAWRPIWFHARLTTSCRMEA